MNSRTAPPNDQGPVLGASPAWARRIVLNGDLEAHEDMVVEGRIQGKITLPSGTLTVAKGGQVEAEVRVRSLVLHGELKGTVRAGEKALISETAEMTGDIITPKITIANGARFSGGIRMKE